MKRSGLARGGRRPDDRGMHSRERWVGVLGIVAAMAAGGVGAADSAHAYVVAVEGHWLANADRTPLAVGSPLPEGARLTPLGATRAHRIVVVAARGGAVLLSLDCAQPAACTAPATLRTTRGPGDAAQDTWLQRVMTRIEGRPDRYVATLSRAPGTPHEAILALADDVVDVAPALAALPPERYAIALQRLDCRPDCAPSGVASLEWSGGTTGSLAIPGARPGVYDLILRRHDSGGLQQARSARVLLLPASQAAAARSRFEAWAGLVDRWPDEVGTGQRRALLRAALDELAEGP